MWLDTLTKSTKHIDWANSHWSSILQPGCKPNCCYWIWGLTNGGSFFSTLEQTFPGRLKGIGIHPPANLEVPVHVMLQRCVSANLGQAHNIRGIKELNVNFIWPNFLVAGLFNYLLQWLAHYLPSPQTSPNMGIGLRKCSSIPLSLYTVWAEQRLPLLSRLIHSFTHIHTSIFFLVSIRFLSKLHKHIHTLMNALGATQNSVSCPKILWQTGAASDQTTNLQTTTYSTFWDTNTPTVWKNQFKTNMAAKAAFHLAYHPWKGLFSLMALCSPSVYGLPPQV